MNEVRNGQSVLYYNSPSSPPVPAIALVYNKDFAQSTDFKVSLLLYAGNPQKQDHKTPVKFYIAQAFHKSHPSREVIQDSSFWEEYGEDTSVKLRALEARLAQLEKFVKPPKDK